MLQSFLKSYQSVIRKENRGDVYPKHIKVLKYVLLGIGLLLLLTYVLFFHDILFYGVPRFVHLRYHPAILTNPSLSFLTYMFDQMFMLLGFFFLVILFVMFSFFALDVCQRNHVIQEEFSKEASNDENK